MKSTSIIAIVVVAILVVAGVGAAVILSNHDNGKDKADYDSAKGWYSWDPTMFKVSTSKLSLSPYMVDQVEDMYKNIYGSAPDYSSYKLEDVPSDFLTYDSLVAASTDDTVTIMSSIRVASGSNSKAIVPVTLEKQPDHLLTTGSYVALLYYLLKEKMSDADAQAKVWDYVYGLDKSAFPNGSADVAQYGLTVPSDVKKVDSTYYLIKNLEKYTEYVDDCTKSDGETLVMMFSGALGNGYADMKPFYDMLDNANPGDAYLLGFFYNGVPDVLAGIEVLGAIYGLEEQAKSYIDNIRLKMYAMSQESAAQNKHYTAYMESTSGTGAGTGTIINFLMTDILSLDNICKFDQWQKLGDEKVIDAQPDVIIFYESDKRTDDAMMRVGTEISAS